MAKGLGDAVAVLLVLKDRYPELDKMCVHGRLELTFQDGVVVQVGPFPRLVRGKDFHVSTCDLTPTKTVV